MKLRHFVLLQAVIAAYSILLPLVFISNAKFPKFVFTLLTIITGALAGAAFPLAAKLYRKKAAETASTLYAADFVGACIGALLVSALLIPLLGIVAVCMVVGALNIIGAVIVSRIT